MKIKNIIRFTSYNNYKIKLKILLELYNMIIKNMKNKNIIWFISYNP